MAKIDTEQLAQETGVPTEHVEKVVRQIIVSKNNHKRQPKLAPPEGGISIRAAGRKYDIAPRTISGWVQRGHIPILLRTKNELYIGEKVLLQIVNRYKVSPGQGKHTVTEN